MLLAAPPFPQEQKQLCGEGALLAPPARSLGAAGQPQGVAEEGDSAETGILLRARPPYWPEKEGLCEANRKGHCKPVFCLQGLQTGIAHAEF